MIWPILDARVEILSIILLLFWKIWDTTILFWDYLTFTAVVSLFLRITELHFSWHTVIVFGSLIQHGATWLDCLRLMFKSLKAASEFEKILCGTDGYPLENHYGRLPAEYVSSIWSILMETAAAAGFWQNSCCFPAVHHWRN